MTGKTHVAIGVSAVLTLSYNQPMENQLVLVLAAIFGSLAPDLDHPKSKLNQKLLFFQNNFYRALFYLSIGGIFIYGYILKGKELFLLVGVVFFFIGLSSHRSFTHSIVGVLASASIVKWITLDYGLASIYSGFIIGYILHLVGDFFTPQGIKLFYPLNTSISFPITFKVNKKSEDIIFTLLSIYSLCLLLGYLKL